MRLIVMGQQAFGKDVLEKLMDTGTVLTAQDVSRLTGRPRNTISRAVNRMLKEGFLKRAPDPSDGRQAKLTITDKGHKLHLEVVEYLIDRQEKILEVLSQQERTQLRSLMRKLAAHTASLAS